MDAPCLIFLHVPKTAGTTMTSVLRLRAKYPLSRRISFETLGRDPSDIGEIPYERRARASLVFGHLHYGVHEWLPQPSRYVTILRDPVRRVISLYNYVRRDVHHPVYRQVVGARMSLGEFVASGLDRTQTENGQTRQLAPVVGRDPTADDLTLAVNNLRGFAIVGLTERFNESLILMKRAFGWRAPYYRSEMVTPGRTLSHTVAPEFLDIIRDKNALDLELYSEAEQFFGRLIAAGGEPFRREVAWFSRVNPEAGPMVAGMASIGRRARRRVRFLLRQS